MYSQLLKLDTGYLDVYLIYQPYGDIHGSWRAKEELYETGKIKSLGVSNFHPDRVMDLMVNNKVKPVINQIETHVFYQREKYNKFLKENYIVHESWAPYAEGKNDFFTNEVLAQIGEKYGKSVAQVVLRWMIQRDVVVIPKSVTKSRIIENFNVFDFELTLEDMETIKTLDTKQSLFFSHRVPKIIKWFSTMIQ